MIDDFARPFTLSVGTVTVTSSIGLTHTADSTSALELLREADIALYNAKRSGRSRSVPFDESLQQQVQRHANLEQRLRGALERGELVVHYQPIVTLDAGDLCGFEALMRWNNPELGAVSPVEFIPIAEDTGLIVPAGAWLLREAAVQLAAWRAARPNGAPELHMSVNIAARQLHDTDLVSQVRDVLHTTGLPPSALWLEITESAAIQEPELSLATLQHLNDLGIVLSLDDFGTGYSSLTYLKSFPTSILKIDRSFVSGIGQDLDDEAIVRTVISMAHSLGQTVVAEGVETAEQASWLNHNGCDMGQGWRFGRPAAAAAQHMLAIGAAATEDRLTSTTVGE
jgi:EAL domain-containing protein (putative c-di-GMP-specific phosphodiesterase class I)